MYYFSSLSQKTTYKKTEISQKSSEQQKTIYHSSGDLYNSCCIRTASIFQQKSICIPTAEKSCFCHYHFFPVVMTWNICLNSIYCTHYSSICKSSATLFLTKRRRSKTQESGSSTMEAINVLKSFKGRALVLAKFQDSYISWQEIEICIRWAGNGKEGINRS